MYRENGTNGNGQLYMFCRLTENGTNGKRQLPIVCCERKMERKTSVCLLQTEMESQYMKRLLET
jgi:hypothetical protein